MRRLLLASLAIMAPGLSGSGGAQPRPAQDRGPAMVRETAERARAAGAEEHRLAERRVNAAATLRATENEVSERAAAVSALAARRAVAEVRLAQHAAALAPLLPLMERLALFPAETLLAAPGQPEQALRGLGVLRGMARQLEHEAAELRQEQAQLGLETTALDAALPGLRAAQATQAAQAQALDVQIATAQGLRRQAESAGAEAQRRAAAEAGRADNLRTALATLETSRARAETQARDDAARADRQRQDLAAAEARRRQEALAPLAGPALEAQGQLVAPVAGSVVRAWGERTDAGPATGVSYRPAPQARVVAPCGGRVRFSGPFRSYGALVILDCGGGYAFVLAGLDRLDVGVGSAVLAGEPIGAMPGWDATSSAVRPALYMELRHDGLAVNPAPFLRGRG